MSSILKKSDIKPFAKDLTFCSLCATFFGISQIIIAFIFSKTPLVNSNEFYGIAYLVYCVICSFFALIFSKKNPNKIEINREKSSPKKMFFCFCYMIGLMVLFTFPVILIDFILLPFGYTLQSIGSANEVSTSITEFIYVAFAGPICEELIFRKFIQERFMKYSPVIAIIVSAISFGVYHCNFGQTFPMIGTGLVFGYVAYKFSVKYSLILHIIYNLFFGEIFGIISDFLNKGNEEFVIPVLNMSPFLCCILLLALIGVIRFYFKFMKEGKKIFPEYKIRFKKLKYLFYSKGFDIFLLYGIGTSFLFLEKL